MYKIKPEWINLYATKRQNQPKQTTHRALLNERSSTLHQEFSSPDAEAPHHSRWFVQQWHPEEIRVRAHRRPLSPMLRRFGWLRDDGSHGLKKEDQGGHQQNMKIHLYIYTYCIFIVYLCIFIVCLLYFLYIYCIFIVYYLFTKNKKKR